MTGVGALGVLYGVGLGRGDPDLLTLKAVRIIQRANILIAPKSAGKHSVALHVLESLVDRDKQEVMELGFPMRSDRDTRVRAREDASLQVVEKLRRGQDVVCVTMGDPLLYSTFSHLYRGVTDALPEVTVEIIPGVSSITACAAAAHIRLACEDERIAIVSATAELADLETILDSFDCVVVLKVSAAPTRVLAALDKTGRRDQAVLVERCGMPDQRILRRITDWSGESCSYFSTLLVRKA